MKYGIIKPKQRQVLVEHFETIHDAQAFAGLDNVDHGVLATGLGYVVYEFAMFVPPAQQSYFGLCGRLIAGPAVLYGFNKLGDTIPLRRSEIPDVSFYLGVNDIEAAIERGEITRPYMEINNIRLWQWPHPAPKGFMP